MAARLLVIAALLLFFALGLRAVQALAPTVDEPLHIMRGFVVWRTGELPHQAEHTPLSHVLIGLPLIGERTAPNLDDLQSWPDGDRQELGLELLWASGLDVDRALFLARLPILLSGVLLAALVASWSGAWLGRGAMVTAALLAAASPNLLASAALATTDFLAAATYFGTVYAWWRYWRWRRRRWWLLTAVFLGLALASKLTAVLLLPVLFLLTLLFRDQARPWWRPFAAYLALLPAAALVLWLVYGLEVGRAGGLLLPAPTYVASWRSVLSHIDQGHQAFFWGELSDEGWWSYFPAALAIKTPLVTLLLLAMGLGVIAVQRTLWSSAAFVLLPAAALFTAAVVSRLNIGYRHILPALPFLLVTASTAVLFLRQQRLTRLLLILLLGWNVAAALRQQPHFLAYFNEVAGGTAQGHRYLGDSNLDWGQDLKALAARVRADGGTWRISYSGTADPGYYGVDPAQLLDPLAEDAPFAVANPPPGRYAISANHWQGLLADRDRFDWFRRRAADATVGGSILIYEVAAQAEGGWVAHCNQPFPLLEAAQAEALIGLSNLRHVWFDCTQSWVLPAGGEPGWVITPQADGWWAQDLLDPQAAQRLQLVYRHRSAAGLPSFDMYYWSGGDLLPDPARAVTTAQDSAGQPLSLPVAANEAAALTGYQVDDDGWTTFWRINEGTARPLSMRAHLYRAGQAAPQVGDNLGYTTEQWAAGDTLWQRFSLPPGGDALFLETGFYDYQTLDPVGSMLRLPPP